MKTIHIPNGILHLNESNAVCPYCKRLMPFEDCEKALSNAFDKGRYTARKKCSKCKRFIGITSDIRGDFVAYEL